LNNKNRWLIIIIIIAIVLVSVTTSISYYYVGIMRPTTTSITTPPKFKVREIYPTKIGGREWFINMKDPTSDGIFHPGSQIIRHADGSWQVGGRETNSKFDNEGRMSVYTPQGQEPWKNVEMTGYAKVISANSLSDHLDWYARGDIHIPDAPCAGTALKGWFSVSGVASWVKEIWFPGGYTDQRDIVHATSDDNSILGRWIGWKVVMYNINNNDKAVKMESYLDDQDNNHWKKITSLVDDCGWYAFDHLLLYLWISHYLILQ
jgi:hypothetical protein